MYENQDQILTLLKQQLPYLKKNFKVKSIGIFGSYAREEQTETSDIEMLVEFEAKKRPLLGQGVASGSFLIHAAAASVAIGAPKPLIADRK